MQQEKNMAVVSNTRLDKILSKLFLKRKEMTIEKI